MEIKVVYIVIHDATVDRYVSASRKCFSIAEKTSMCRGQVGGVRGCSDHDRLLRCGQTVAPRYRVLKRSSVLGECLVISSLPGKALRTLVDIAKNFRIYSILIHGIFSLKMQRYVIKI